MSTANEYAAELCRKLKRCTQPYASKMCAVCFSGGVDSSILAALLPTATLYTVGTEDAQDVQFARDACSAMKRNLVHLVVNRRTVERALPHLSRLLGTTSPSVLSYELPLYLIVSTCSEKTIISGQGADELFGGYARYLKMEKERAQHCMDADAVNLLSGGIDGEKQIATYFGKEIFFPYLDSKVVEFARSLPFEQRISNKQGKKILRDAAEILGLPDFIAKRPKKAAQYGAGIVKILRKNAKYAGLKTGEYVRHIVSQKIKGGGE